MTDPLARREEEIKGDAVLFHGAQGSDDSGTIKGEAIQGSDVD